MASNRTLRAIDETMLPPRVPTVIEAAANDSHRELLVAMRGRIARALQDEKTPPRDLASLSLRLLAIAKDIEALNAAEGVDDVGSATATADEEWTAT